MRINIEIYHKRKNGQLRIKNITNRNDIRCAKTITANNMIETNSKGKMRESFEVPPQNIIKEQ